MLGEHVIRSRIMETTRDSTRHKCVACFKQYNKMEHLVEHMKLACHSEHEPICGICKKHCRFFDSLREHLVGPLPKAECSEQFSKRGCSLCLIVFDTPEAAIIHRGTCQLQLTLPPRAQAEGRVQSKEAGLVSAVALDCEMVGGGQDGSFDLCARVCLIDEEENVLFDTYVEPQIPVTDYRFNITGIKPEHLIDAMPLKIVADTIKCILCNGEEIYRVRMTGGKAMLLVGHDLDHDLQCLTFEYPSHLIRDTSKYQPLLKTGKTNHSLKYLTETLLGYKIQTGVHDPYEDAVATMRLYKKMRSQVHLLREGQGFASLKQSELEKLSPDALLAISRSDFRCWCLDARSRIC